MPAVEVDVEELEQRASAVAGRWSAGAGVGELERLVGGRASVTYRAWMTGGAGDRAVVIKVAPPGVPPVKNRDVLRQARVLRSLEGAPGLRVPKVMFEDPGAPPEVPPFFVMEHVDGECFEPILDPIEGEMLPPGEVRARELHLAGMLAALHDVRPDRVGLGEEPVVSLAEELDRWVQLFDTMPEDMRPRVPEATAALQASMPEPLPPVILHGDFRLGNTLARDGEIRAVIDWEIWTIGDPRIDLGWYLMSTHPSKQPTALREAPGMPPDDELVATYEKARRVGLEAMDWFHALTRFKAGAITAQIIKHNERRPDPDPIVAKWGRTVPVDFVDQAMHLLGPT